MRTARTPSQAQIKWVVFDLGRVVLAGTSKLAELAALLNITVETLTDGYQKHRLDYDRNSDAALFWAGVAADAGIASPTGDLLAELVEMDEDGWSGTIAPTMMLIDDLRTAGFGLAVCSNAPSSMGVKIRDAPWAAAFQHFVFSGDLGVVKPAPEIFEAVLTATGGSASSTVFLDDLAVNVDGARAVGWHAFQFTDAAQARHDLALLGVLSPLALLPIAFRT